MENELAGNTPMLKSGVRLVLFPGLGADERLFTAQRQAFPGLEVPPWLKPRPRESLEAYGARTARAINVRPREPLYVGGASFGGPVALEVARHVSPRAVFLIGSCRNRAAIAPAYRLLCRLARPLPTSAFAGLMKLAPLGIGLFGAATSEQRNAFLAQLAAASPSFVRWGVHALMGWSPSRDLNVPVHHVHGGNDHLLPCRRASPDFVIPDAGHLLNVTHAAEVNRFILERIGA